MQVKSCGCTQILSAHCCVLLKQVLPMRIEITFLSRFANFLPVTCDITCHSHNCHSHIHTCHTITVTHVTCHRPGVTQDCDVSVIHQVSYQQGYVEIKGMSQSH